MNVSVDQIRKQRKYCCICKGVYRGQFVDGRVVSLHRFPQNKRLKRVWIQRCKTVMRTFVWNEHRRLCSEHFVGYRGPSLEHTLPSLFPTENGSTKEFTSSKLDENQMVEIDDNEGMMSGNSQCDSIQDESRPTSDSDGHVTVHDAETMMDVSVSLHDYCASPVVKSRKTGIRSSYVQTYPDCKMQEVQTDLVEVKLLVDASTQTEHLTEDKGVQCRLPNLTYHDVKNNDDMVCFYTGIPNAKVFDALFDEIKDEAEERTSRRQLNYNPTQGGRPRMLTVIDEFFMVLMRLRLGLLLEDLSFRFGISTTHCSDICNRWIDFLAVQLSFLVQWPSMDVIKRNMPTVFKEKFPKTRIIIDCTEIYTETPSSLKLKSLMYSDYKSHMTYKALVGVSPNGVVTFVSDLWCGSISDKQITKESGLLDLCSEGDAIMADKGFTISDLTTPKGIDLIIPPFKRKNQKFAKREVLLTKDIATCRIHVEREMERIKNFRILLGNIPITMAARSSKVFKICTFLTNLQPPLVQN